MPAKSKQKVANEETAAEAVSPVEDAPLSLEEQERRAVAAIEDRKQRLETLAAEIAAAEASLTALSARIRQMESDLAAMPERVASAEADIVIGTPGAEQRLATLRELAQDGSAQLERLRAEKTSLQSAREALMGEQASINNLLPQLEQRRRDLHRERGIARRAELQAELAARQETLAQAQAALAEAEAAVVALHVEAETALRDFPEIAGEADSRALYRPAGPSPTEEMLVAFAAWLRTLVNGAGQIQTIVGTPQTGTANVPGMIASVIAYLTRAPGLTFGQGAANYVGPYRDYLAQFEQLIAMMQRERGAK